MGDQSQIGTVDAGEHEPSRRRGYFASEPPGPAFNTVYEALEIAAELYHGLTVEEVGFDQYEGRRKGGWIADRGTAAPNRTTRVVRLRSGVLEPSLDLLMRREEKLSAQNAEELRRRVNTVNAKRDISIYGEGNQKDVTISEIERTVERVVKRENSKLRDDFLNAIAASTGYDPVVEAEATTEEEAA